MSQDFCEGSGVTIQDVTGSVSNQAVTDIDNGDYIKFTNVDFGNDYIYNSINVLASSNTSGGTIEVRSGSPSGILLATVEVNNTNGWDTYKLFSSDANAQITGMHDLYFVFTGASGSLLNIDNFYFRYDGCFGKSYNISNGVINAIDYCDMVGIFTANNNTQVGGINDGDWIRFSNVDFTSISPEEITLMLGGNQAGGSVNVMLDHPRNGTMIATTTLNDNGGYNNATPYNVALNQAVTGVHNLYFYFVGGGFDMQSFEFHEERFEAINLALATNGGIASQSSTAHDGLASKGNDGNTNGNFGGGSVTHTEDTGEGILKWWEVDLGADKTIICLSVRFPKIIPSI